MHGRGKNGKKNSVQRCPLGINLSIIDMINKLTRFCVAQLLSGSHWAFKFSLRLIKTMYTGTLFIKMSFDQRHC